MDSERNERRARMLEKVRKLLSMARDGRGNDNEEEIAMRQANKLMAEYGIAEAECDMSAINAGDMSFGEAQCGPDGRAPEQGKVYRSVPAWAGVLGVGVARFTDSVIVRKRTANGEMFVFQGEREDVLLARWLFGVLVQSIQSEQRASGWTAQGEASSFRMAAASALQSRLRTLAAERVAMYEKARVESNSRALVVVDRKRSEIVARFGTQKTSSSRARYRDSGAAMAGSEAGRRINIPAGRPVGNNSKALLN
jgi:hypothetical protein